LYLPVSRYAQDGECKPRERGITSSLQRRRAVHQLRRGFGHLLPLPLRCRESDILALLKENGPQTQRQLCEALGVASLNTMGQRWLSRLLNLGLVEIVGCVAYTPRGRRRLFSIAARALPAAEHRPLSHRPLDLEPLRIAYG
jgi:DNA-binding MarR family transcriptional regulator